MLVRVLMAEEAAACVVAAGRAGGEADMAELQDEVTTRCPFYLSSPEQIVLSFNCHSGPLCVQFLLAA